jgi:hypothetical protein
VSFRDPGGDGGGSGPGGVGGRGTPGNGGESGRGSGLGGGVIAAGAAGALLELPEFLSIAAAVGLSFECACRRISLHRQKLT